MSKFLHFKTQNNYEYGYLYNPHRINGIKVNDPIYIGRVIDKDNGIFKNKERGVFKYSLINGYETTDYKLDEYNIKIKKEKYI
ncbi:MAG: hypothetical protein LBM96_03680 [Methanobrevibacter sp.]|jgi:hypothetical protein|nr:hypothetical protein [Candidatus Methanoflexus mossambicus]